MTRDRPREIGVASQSFKGRPAGYLWRTTVGKPKNPREGAFVSCVLIVTAIANQDLCSTRVGRARSHPVIRMKDMKANHEVKIALCLDF